jgi:hypothetical protein
MNEKINQLQQELYDVLKKSEHNKLKISIFRSFCYGGALLYFLGIVAMQIFTYSGNISLFTNDYELNPNPTFFEQNKILVLIIPLFVLIIIGGYGLSFFMTKYGLAEQNSVRRIIRTMFPDAKLALLPSEISPALLQQSNFFGGVNSENTFGHSTGMIIFETGDSKIVFRDLILHTTKPKNLLAQIPLFGGLFIAIEMMFKGLFSKRVENIAGNFRGMFANAQLEKKINGTVVVLPDRLERHLDYLAKNIQALKNVNGNKLLTLEDVEFERYFVVYASDEITARYVLTPAMMLRMTELKKKYDREIMLSFSGNHFYFAVAMPEGFLTLGDSSLTSGEALKDLYDNIATAQEILKNLRLT